MCSSHALFDKKSGQWKKQQILKLTNECRRYYQESEKKVRRLSEECNSLIAVIIQNSLTFPTISQI